MMKNSLVLFVNWKWWLTLTRCLSADRPDPPYDVKLKSCNVMKAVVVWTPGSDNNDPIDHYIIYYNTSFDEPDYLTEGTRVNAMRVCESEENPMHKCAAVRLQPWTKFKFTVQAHNSLGLSDHSAFTPGLCTTPPQRPQRNPSGVCSVSRGPNELVITWQVFTGYSVTVISWLALDSGLTIKRLWVRLLVILLLCVDRGQLFTHVYLCCQAV